MHLIEGTGTAGSGTGTPRTTTWEDWAQEVLAAGHERRGPDGTKGEEAASKEAGRWFSPIESDPPERRAKAAVQRVHMLVFDLDGLTRDEVATLTAELDSGGEDYLLWTTHSHGAEHKRGKFPCRIAMPLSRPVEAADWPVFWAAANKVLARGLADTACRGAQGFYFYPSCPDVWYRYGLAELVRGPGRHAVDPDGVLDAASQLETRAAVPEQVPDGTPALAIQWKTRKDLRDLAKKAPGVYADQLGRLAKGEAPVDAGSGRVHERLTSLMGWLARRWPETDPDCVAELTIQGMSALAAQDRRIGERTYDLDRLARMFREFQEQAKEEQQRPENAWRQGLDWTKLGEVRQCQGNLVAVTTLHPDLDGALGWDERRQRAVWLRDPPWSEDRAGTDLTDADATACTHWLLGLTPSIVGSSATCHEALTFAARCRPFDRVRDYLLGLEWDGVDRLDRWLVDYAGAEDTPYVRAVGPKWVISAVARALRPGCQVDTTLILEGPQGIRKSTLLRTMAEAPPGADGGEHGLFLDQVGDLGHKDTILRLQGPWIVEIAELSTFRRADAAAIKAFLPIREDHVRQPYGRTTEVVPRRIVFAGTINPEGDGAYLLDPTGGRRFWPVKATRCRPEALVEVRDQLWAEALHRYRAGEAWWLDEETEAVARKVQADVTEGEPWEEPIRDWLRGEDVVDTAAGQEVERDAEGYRVEVRLPQVWSDALEGPVERLTMGAARRIGRVLRGLGYHRRHTRAGKVWVREP